MEGTACVVVVCAAMYSSVDVLASRAKLKRHHQFAGFHQGRISGNSSKIMTMLG
jgi:hypothetical protein